MSEYIEWFCLGCAMHWGSEPPGLTCPYCDGMLVPEQEGEYEVAGDEGDIDVASILRRRDAPGVTRRDGEGGAGGAAGGAHGA